MVLHPWRPLEGELTRVFYGSEGVAFRLYDTPSVTFGDTHPSRGGQGLLSRFRHSDDRGSFYVIPNEVRNLVL